MCGTARPPAQAVIILHAPAPQACAEKTVLAYEMFLLRRLTRHERIIKSKQLLGGRARYVPSPFPLARSPSGETQSGKEEPDQNAAEGATTPETLRHMDRL